MASFTIGGRKCTWILSSVCLVLAAVLQLTESQQCGFPSAWQYTWWKYNDPATSSRFFREYGLTHEKNLQQIGTGPLSQIDRHDCQEEENRMPYIYYTRRLTSNINVEDCVKGYADNTGAAKLDAQLLVIAHVRTGTTGFKAIDCTTRQDYSTPVDVFVRYPFDFTRACPFPVGRYQVALSTVSAAQSSCLGDRNSYLIVAANGRISLTSCLTGDSYEQPFQGTELQCVGGLAPGFIGSTVNNGNVYILAHTSAAGVTNFYTARYNIAGNGAVLMSLQGSTSGRLQPDPNKRFDTVGVINSNFDYSFLMQPANCNNIQCENNAACENVDTEINFRCVCLPGFSGRFCEVDNDECTAGICSGNGVCTDLVNDFNCDCDAGWVGKNCQTRDFCDNAPCGANGDCTSRATTYECDCDPGYVGQNCETQQFCFNDPCQNSGVCTEQGNGYSCSCQAGYTGTNCETFLYCYDKPCVFGSCSENVNTFRCTCQAGYSGERCTDAIQCYNNPCQNGGECVESADGTSYTCNCQDGFTDQVCSTVQYCFNHGCKNGATCREDDSTYSCICPPGYVGWNCGTKLHCADQPCVNGICIEEANTYSCDCSVGWTGYKCDTPDLCSNLPCFNGGTCLEVGAGGIQCTCRPGYSGDRCQYENACRNDGFPCLNGGNCQDTGSGTYTCSCTSEYTGNNCQTPITSGACANNNCQNSATCIPQGANNYVCECAAGYSGALCSEDACVPNPCDNDGACMRQDLDAFSEGYYCECLDGFTGPTCNFEGSCGGQPCIHGSCGGDDQCLCEDGWTGDDCNAEMGFDWTILIIILVILLVLVFIVLAILVCVCCVMRNNGNAASTESKPAPKPVTPAGPVIREVIIPPQQPQVIRVDNQQQQKPPNMITTSAMFMSENPQKVYKVNNPLDYQYTAPSQGIYGNRQAPQQQQQVKYVGMLEPAGQQTSYRGDIDASIYPDVDASDYIKFGANALTGSKTSV